MHVIQLVTHMTSTNAEMLYLGSLDGGVVGWFLQLDFLLLLLSSPDEGEVLHDGDPRILRQLYGFLVTYPAVDATTTTVYPEKVSEAKVL